MASKELPRNEWEGIIVPLLRHLVVYSKGAEVDEDAKVEERKTRLFWIVYFGYTFKS